MAGTSPAMTELKRRVEKQVKGSRGGAPCTKKPPVEVTGGQWASSLVLRGLFYLKAIGIGAGCLPSFQRTPSMTS